MGEKNEYFEERRAADKRIEAIQKTVEDIRNILQSEHGICVRMSIVESRIQSTQTELSEHKEDHKVKDKEKKETSFRWLDILLVVGMFVLGILGYIKAK